MVSLQYAYLVFALLFFFYFLFLLYRRPDLQKGMISMGLLLIIAGVIGQYFIWTVDWWKPQTITHTKIGIEDILHAVTVGGVATALYPTIFKKRFAKMKKKKQLMSAIFISVLSLGTSLGLFYLLGIHSFPATLGGVFLIFCFILLQRRDLVGASVFSGCLLLMVSIPVYLLMSVLSPEFVESAWKFEYLSGIILFHTPLEDLVFYGSVGTVVLPLYLYGSGMKLQQLL